VLVDVVDGADVGVVEGGGGSRLALEPLQGDPVVEELLGQELQGHPTTQTRVLGLVDHAHSAPTEPVQDAVVGDGLADHGKRGSLEAVAVLHAELGRILQGSGTRPAPTPALDRCTARSYYLTD